MAVEKNLFLADSDYEKNFRIAYLISCFIQEKLTPAEREELDEWVGASNENLVLFEELTDEENLKRSLLWYRELDFERARKRVHEKIGFSRTPFLWRGFFRYAVAVMILIGLGSGIYFFLRSGKEEVIIGKNDGEEVQPGSAKAVLTLGDGRKMFLESLSNGTIAIEGRSRVLKADSLLSYHTESGAEDPASLHVLTVPRGGQFQLVLADGSKVWLNAASSLRFPSHFSGKERLVELEGEAYFEIAPDAQKPFLVNTNGARLQVLGTHFNVSAYSGEKNTIVSLLEGALRVSREEKNVMLRPGNQLLIQNAGGSDPFILNRGADIEAAVAWKNGWFIFRDEELQDAMKKIERWYNISVSFEGRVDQHFNGSFQRTVPLTKLLKYLEGTNQVHFQIKKNHVTVLP